MKGRIVDEKNVPIAYAHIGIKGSSIGTISDEGGLFSLDISDMGNADIFVISSVGYNPQEFSFSQLPKEGKFKVVLKRKIYTNDDIEIIAPAIRKKTYGSIKPKRKSGWNFSGIANGNQIGMIFDNTDSIILSKLKFHVKIKGYDSLLFRVNFYEIKNNELTIINKKDIFKLSKINNGIININLDKYDIYISNKFAVTIEILKGWKNENAGGQTEIIFTGRNSIRKETILKSHQFAPIEYIGMILNILVEYFSVDE